MNAVDKSVFPGEELNNSLASRREKAFSRKCIEKIASDGQTSSSPSHNIIFSNIRDRSDMGNLLNQQKSRDLVLLSPTTLFGSPDTKQNLYVNDIKMEEECFSSKCQSDCERNYVESHDDGVLSSFASPLAGLSLSRILNSEILECIPQIINSCSRQEQIFLHSSSVISSIKSPKQAIETQIMATCHIPSRRASLSSENSRNNENDDFIGINDETESEARIQKEIWSSLRPTQIRYTRKKRSPYRVPHFNTSKVKCAKMFEVIPPIKTGKRCFLPVRRTSFPRSISLISSSTLEMQTEKLGNEKCLALFSNAREGKRYLHRQMSEPNIDTIQSRSIGELGILSLASPMTLPITLHGSFSEESKIVNILEKRISYHSESPWLISNSTLGCKRTFVSPDSHLGRQKNVQATSQHKAQDNHQLVQQELSRIESGNVTADIHSKQACTKLQFSDDGRRATTIFPQNVSRTKHNDAYSCHRRHASAPELSNLLDSTNPQALVLASTPESQKLQNDASDEQTCASLLSQRSLSMEQPNLGFQNFISSPSLLPLQKPSNTKNYLSYDDGDVKTILISKDPTLSLPFTFSNSSSSRQPPLVTMVRDSLETASLSHDPISNDVDIEHVIKKDSSNAGGKSGDMNYNVHHDNDHSTISNDDNNSDCLLNKHAYYENKNVNICPSRKKKDSDSNSDNSLNVDDHDVIDDANDASLNFAVAHCDMNTKNPPLQSSPINRPLPVISSGSNIQLQERFSASDASLPAADRVISFSPNKLPQSKQLHPSIIGVHFGSLEHNIAGSNVFGSNVGCSTFSHSTSPSHTPPPWGITPLAGFNGAGWWNERGGFNVAGGVLGGGNIINNGISGAGSLSNNNSAIIFHLTSTLSHRPSRLSDASTTDVAHRPNPSVNLPPTTKSVTDSPRSSPPGPFGHSTALHAPRGIAISTTASAGGMCNGSSTAPFIHGNLVEGRGGGNDALDSPFTQLVDNMVGRSITVGSELLNTLPAPLLPLAPHRQMIRGNDDLPLEDVLVISTPGNKTLRPFASDIIVDVNERSKVVQKENESLNEGKPENVNREPRRNHDVEGTIHADESQQHQSNVEVQKQQYEMTKRYHLHEVQHQNDSFLHDFHNSRQIEGETSDREGEDEPPVPIAEWRARMLEAKLDFADKDQHYPRKGSNHSFSSIFRSIKKKFSRSLAIFSKSSSSYKEDISLEMANNFVTPNPINDHIVKADNARGEDSRKHYIRLKNNRHRESDLLPPPSSQGAIKEISSNGSVVNHAPEENWSLSRRQLLLHLATKEGGDQKSGGSFKGQNLVSRGSSTYLGTSGMDDLVMVEVSCFSNYATSIASGSGDVYVTEQQQPLIHLGIPRKETMAAASHMPALLTNHQENNSVMSGLTLRGTVGASSPSLSHSIYSRRRRRLVCTGEMLDSQTNTPLIGSPHLASPAVSFRVMMGLRRQPSSQNSRSECESEAGTNSPLPPALLNMLNSNVIQQNFQQHGTFPHTIQPALTNAAQGINPGRSIHTALSLGQNLPSSIHGTPYTLCGLSTPLYLSC
mmetsp:Transcript_17935/g.32743  ORF Transcript_17935/g.32743 Transcript_17935/m.32743 type:complete len:1541 (-) Transcript_17935:3447-8069(-)